MRISFAALFVLLTGLPIAASAASPDVQTDNEVERLIEFIKASPCQFNRNGSWYASNEAAGHIDKKYHAALEKDLVHSAEDFISYAASKSSLTGMPYTVQCQGIGEMNCSEWLTAELRKVREEKKQ